MNTDGPETRPESDPTALLTLRVSRDSGRTWASRTVVRSTDTLAPLLTSLWPPCRCPLHRPQD